MTVYGCDYGYRNRLKRARGMIDSIRVNGLSLMHDGFDCHQGY
jgi:hypothetical protein